MIPKDTLPTEAFFALNGKTDITWNYNSSRPLRRECGIVPMNGLYHADNA